MASSMIHICIAKEVNKVLKRKEKELLIGSIAPDISKHIGKTKLESHYLDLNSEYESVPDLDLFLNKYSSFLYDDFVMGYYIHLFTDYFWFRYFIIDFVKKDFIYDINNKKLHLTKEEKSKYIYNDYTNLNIKLIDDYNLDLAIFYEQIPDFKNIIKEIPMDKLQLIVNKVGIIIKNSKESKPYIFDDQEIKKFITLTTSAMIDNLKQLKKLDII